MRATLLVTALGILEGSILAFGLSSQVPPWRDPSPHVARRVTVDSTVQLQVLDWGGSGTPVVLLGCYLSAHMYDEFAPKLTNGFHVYGITRRGIGESDKPAAGYSVQRSANDVLEVLDSLNVEKTLLVGHSCAGQILTVFAAQHSDRLNGLVYLDGATDPTMRPKTSARPCPIRRTCRARSSLHRRPTTRHLKHFTPHKRTREAGHFPQANYVSSSSRTKTVRSVSPRCRPLFGGQSRLMLD